MDYLILNNINGMTLACDCRSVRCGNVCPIFIEDGCGAKCEVVCGMLCESFCGVRYCDSVSRSVPWSI